MSNDQTPAADRGSELSDQLGQAPERAAFARWCRENGHGELDDMLTPLDRSLRALMWPVWQGAMAAERERWAPLVAALLGTELGELASVGSHAPVEDVLGRLKDVLGPNAKLTWSPRDDH